MDKGGGAGAVGHDTVLVITTCLASTRGDRALQSPVPLTLHLQLIKETPDDHQFRLDRVEPLQDLGLDHK